MSEIYCTRTWVPCNDVKDYTQSITLYDNGSIQGIVSTEFSNFYKLESRGYIQNGYIQETGILTSEIPLHFLSIESYPASIQRISETLHIWIPFWHLLVTECALDSPSQNHLLAHLEQQQKHPTSQQHQQPSSLRQSIHRSPASPGPGKSHYSKPGQSQRNAYNMKNTAPKPTSSPSSNPTFREQQRGPNPMKPVPRHPPPSSKSQSVRRLPSSLPPYSTLPSPSSPYPPTQS